jgi:hypothetical protein
MSFGQDGSAKASVQEKEGPKLSFNGLGRTYIGQTSIGGEILDTDSSTVASLTDGEFLLDLAINAQPNKKTEVQTILRLRNEFGGFFGSGMSVEVRELWARGIIGDVLKYRVGDMDMVMTPYTLFNSDEEGMLNEASVFKAQRDLLHYEQFYTDNNTRRLQGGNIEFGLDFTSVLEEMNMQAFIARIRGTDFFTVPSRFISGVQADFSVGTLSESLGTKLDFGLNLTHTADDLQSGDANDGIRNSVYSFDFDLLVMDKEKLSVAFVGELGRSALISREDSIEIFNEGDSFLDIGINLNHKPTGLKLNASFVDVGPDFFSIGAQSKRIDFAANKSYYNRLGLEDELRMPSIFDMSRDRALYTYQLSDNLMRYDPRFSNAMPYGDATPNRRGVKLNAAYQTKDEVLGLEFRGAFLNEIRGQGTFELKSFTNLQVEADVNLAKMMRMKKTLDFTAGYQFESTQRGGIEVQQVDLNSNMIDLGLDAELFSNFHVMLGAKVLAASGSDYVPLVTEFNDVKDFPSRFEVDDLESLYAAGLKYNFREDVYITLQYQSFSSRRGESNPNDYKLNQIFVLYSMNF